MKKRIYSITFFLILIPFILVTDIFPFLRFGMFAEPLKKDQKAEIFFATEQDSLGKEKVFDPEQYELQEETFQYLMRNYYYRGDASLFLDKLSKSIKADTNQILLKFY